MVFLTACHLSALRQTGCRVPTVNFDYVRTHAVTEISNPRLT
jgi:hypothetical protein